MIMTIYQNCIIKYNILASCQAFPVNILNICEYNPLEVLSDRYSTVDRQHQKSLKHTKASGQLK